ncbi:MAG: hypothetical protein HY738_10000 [Bacteroidia bacterium]|nr:hypothetical protein [Bacteroidia bacterium]
MVKYISYIVIFVIITSCSDKTQLNTFQEYAEYLNDPENGLIKIKTVNGYELKVHYLPPAYSAYLELSQDSVITKKEADSVLKDYLDGLTFMLSIGPDKNRGYSGNIMYNGITKYEEYKERLINLSFSIENFVTLKTGNEIYSPVLSSFDFEYGLKENKNILFVFLPINNNNSFHTSDNLDFVFEDFVFDTGMNHFVFNRKDINSLPEFNFWNYEKNTRI